MEVESLQREILELRKKLQVKEDELEKLQSLTNEDIVEVYCSKLSNAEIARFSRQIIIPEVGAKGQISLKTSSVLIVGAGGLGCPAALYLAGAGVGCIGLVDYDYVELNNLHRQLLHVETSVGQSKAYSAAQNLRRLNSAIKIIPHHIQLSSENALDIIGKYSVVIDATDNLPTRYLLNDACVMLSRPLVSGSALQLEGQLTVYNYKKGPCYRCMFPTPPPPESVTNCGDGGVLGAVPGVIGVLQALEATKILLGVPGILSGRLLVFDAADSSFRSVYLRKRNELCCVCGDQPTITRLIDYEQFCRVKANDKVCDGLLELFDQR